MKSTVGCTLSIVVPLITALLWTFPATGGMMPQAGYRTTTLYDTEGTFTTLGAMSRDGGRLYIGNSVNVLSMNLANGNVRIEGTLPPNTDVPIVQRYLGSTIVAFGTSYAFPYPYQFGFLAGSGSFTNLLSVDGVFDAALNPQGELFVVANPGAAGSRIYKYHPMLRELVEVANIGGYSGGMAFDNKGNLYYACQSPGQIVRFSPTQIANGGLTLTDAEVINDVVAGYLACDENDYLYATVGFGASLNKYSPQTGALLKEIAAAGEPAGWTSIGKTIWEEAGKRFFINYTDWNAFAGYLHEMIAPYVLNDFSRGGQADIAVYDTATGNWYVRSAKAASAPIIFGQNWGNANCVPVPGDYNGDSFADLAVYDRTTGDWFIRSAGGNGELLAYGLNWGSVDCVPVSGDYDGDGVWDLAVYNRENGEWFIRSLADGPPILFGMNWGGADLTPIGGDFNGDGLWDLGVYEEGTGNWFIRSLTDGPPLLFGMNWGFEGCVPLGGDYDGDGQWDIGAYEAVTGSWFIRSLNNGDPITFGQVWGDVNAQPVAGDFNADGVFDLAVYQKTSGQWFILPLGAGAEPVVVGMDWGGSGLVAVGGW